MDAFARKRVLIFIVAYNAERTVQDVLRRLPPALAAYDTEVLIIDDSSQDRTFEKAHQLERSGEIPFAVTVLFNPVNQGYGGNQKIGFHYAVEHGFDAVALLHGDGQYAPEKLPDLLTPLFAGAADAVFGSRMIGRFDALRGGMPLYKFAGNKVLTSLQNRLLNTSLSEFHSGYRVYAVPALRRIPFNRNTNDFHFDTEIILQLLRAGLRIQEVPIPTYYGDEICRVSGLQYAFRVLQATLLARMQDLGIFYDRKFDLSAPTENNPLYRAKLGYESPHTLALERVTSGTAVLDIGCASGHLARALHEKGCLITGIDQYPAAAEADMDRFLQHDLNQPELPVEVGDYDYVLLLDVIEHLRRPEQFAEVLRNSQQGGDTEVIVSTGNVAFFITRLMLLLGFFNYGARGILDLTHTRLFTFRTLRKLFEQAGYRIEEVRGVPAPFPLALGDNRLARVLLAANRLLIRLSQTLFSYQIFMIVRPLPALPQLLDRALESRRARILQRQQHSL